MKTAIILSISVLLILYAGKTSVSFNPFKIEFERPAQMLGIIFLGLGLLCLNYQSNKDGFDKGVEATTKYIKDQRSKDTK